MIYVRARLCNNNNNELHVSAAIYKKQNLILLTFFFQEALKFFANPLILITFNFLFCSFLSLRPHFVGQPLEFFLSTFLYLIYSSFFRKAFIEMQTVDKNKLKIGFVSFYISYVNVRLLLILLFRSRKATKKNHFFYNI